MKLRNKNSRFDLFIRRIKIFKSNRSAAVEELFKILLWIAVFLLLGVGLYFMLRELTG